MTFNLNHWDKDYIINNFGKNNAVVSNALHPIKNKNIKCTINKYYDEYYNNEYQMIYNICNLKEYVDIPDEYLKYNLNFALLLYGNKNTGTGPHHHNEAINYLISGQKKWLMWDSGVNTKGLELANDLSSTYKNDTCKKLLDNEYDNKLKQFKKDGGEIKEIIQNPGDIVVVPKDWTHLILNNADDTCAITFWNNKERKY